MKINHTRSPRTLAVLLPTLLMAAPAFAQETQTTPPSAPEVQSAPASVAQPAPAPAPVFAPASPVVQDPSTVKAPPAVPTAGDLPASDTGTPATRRTAPAQRTARSTAPVRTAPRPASAATSQPAPVATPPVAAAPAPVTPATQAAPVATTQTTTTQSGGSIWPWIVGAGIVLLGLIALMARRRRRDEAVYDDEPVYAEQPLAEPMPVIAPVAAAPLVDPQPQHLRPAAALATDPVAAPAPVPAEETHIADADQADVDALTDGHAPVADRPWLEFGMRPIRAGTTSDEALVEIELTVGNAGSVAADDVRISTFLFASEPADAAEFEQMLIEHGNDGTPDTMSIAAGEGTRVDATLALPKRDLAALFNPVVVADARYRLPDGSEGRTFASFSIGMTQADGELGGIENERPAMHEDVEARLYGTPEHV